MKVVAVSHDQSCGSSSAMTRPPRWVCGETGTVTMTTSRPPGKVKKWCQGDQCFHSLLQRIPFLLFVVIVIVIT